MSSDLSLDRLDDPAALESLDASQMLRAVATAAAQVRRSRTSAAEADLAPLDLDSRPRAVVVAGMGGSGISGDVLSTIAAPACPVPILVHRGEGLPGWVGAADLVMAVSCSGTTTETLSSAIEAARRGARLLGVGAEGSPLDLHCRSEHGAFVPVVKELAPRASLWALAVPLLMVARAAGFLDLGPGDADLEAAAERLESIATACRPDLESFVNPAKILAADLAGGMPTVWGCGQVGPVAALRTAAQLAENAKRPAVWGALPEAHHNQVVAFEAAAAGAEADFFRDRIDDAEPTTARLVLLRDDSDDAAARRADISEEVAAARAIPVTTLRAEGAAPLERLASLVGLLDFASVYTALALGVDPTPIAPIDDVKRLIG